MIQCLQRDMRLGKTMEIDIGTIIIKVREIGINDCFISPIVNLIN
jgi:hypothetical protein